MLNKLTLGDKVRWLFGIGKKEDEILDDLEDVLIEGDIGPRIAIDIVSELRTESKKGRLGTKEELTVALKSVLGRHIKSERIVPVRGELNVFLVLGVNGVGKTTTVAKLAEYYRRTEGIERILLCAADTFRAAAIDQLKIHGERLDIKVIHHAPGADPGAVVFDTITSAVAHDSELVIVDTAGRLHNKENLVKELVKIDKIVMSRIKPACYRKLLVLDATTGQNAYRQAETFRDAVNIDSIILAKFDSSAKGGIAISISRDLGVPFAFLGTGERPTDLVSFDPQAFIDILLGEGEASSG